MVVPLDKVVAVEAHYNTPPLADLRGTQRPVLLKIFGITRVSCNMSHLILHYYFTSLQLAH